MELKQVTCGDCGYLCAVRHNGDIVEATPHFRKNYHFPDGNLPTLQCLQDLRSYSPSTNTPQVDQLKGFLDKPYACDGYTKYRCGFSPKEHMQMTLDQELRAKHAAEAEKLRLWQEEIRLKDKKARKWELLLAAVVGLFFEPLRLVLKVATDWLIQHVHG